MNKTELIKSIAAGANVSQGTATKMLAAMQEMVSNALTHGEKVSVRSFGTFMVSEHAARRCRHPQNGELMTTPAYRTVRFVPSAQLRQTLN